MMLSDFFAQNVRGFGAQLHAKLAPGANELTPAPPHFLRLLRTLLYATSFDPDANFAERPTEPARAGFIFTHGGETYRLLRDFGTGAVQLALKTTELQPIATVAPDVVQRLRGMGLPSLEAFDAIYALSVSDFPSRRAAKSAGRGQADIEAALAILRARPRVARASDALEFELDGLQKKKYGWEDLAKRRAKLAAEVEQWRARLEQGAWLEQLPADFAKRVTDFENSQRKHANELSELGEDDGEAPPTPTSLVRNWQLWLGVVLGMLFLVLGAALSGQARFIGLLDIAAFGWAVIVALQSVSESEAHERFVHRVARRQDVRRRIEEKFTADSQMVRGVLAKANGATAKELIEQQGQREQLRAVAAASQAKLGEFDAGDGAELRSWGAEQVEVRILEIEEQLALSSAGPPDRTLSEIAVLERELATASGAPSGPFSAQSVVLALAEQSGGDVTQAVAPLGARAGQFVSQWWGRASVIFVDERGVIMCDGTGLAQLPSETQDQVWLAVRLAAFELCAQNASGALWLFELDTLPHLQTAWLTTYVPFVSQNAQALVCGAAPAFALPAVSLT